MKFILFYEKYPKIAASMDFPSNIYVEKELR
jgi:hypothetical protein